MVVDAEKLVVGQTIYVLYLTYRWVCVVTKAPHTVHNGIPVVHVKNEFGFEHEFCLRDFGVDGVDYNTYNDERPPPRMFTTPDYK